MSICEKHNCSQCRHEREVILTHQDLTRLRTMGHYEETFARKSRHGHNLKELIFENGDCVFLKNGRCSVYYNRPLACKIFPYTFDGEKGLIDINCPHAGEFRSDPSFLPRAEMGMESILDDIDRTLRNYLSSLDGS